MVEFRMRHAPTRSGRADFLRFMAAGIAALLASESLCGYQ
jgi:hypothetical protein